MISFKNFLKEINDLLYQQRRNVALAAHNRDLKRKGIFRGNLPAKKHERFNQALETLRKNKEEQDKANPEK